MSINPLQKYHHIHQDLFENGYPIPSTGLSQKPMAIGGYTTPARLRFASEAEFCAAKLRQKAESPRFRLGRTDIGD